MRGLFALSLCTFLLMFTVPAQAQEHKHPAQDVALHELFYKDWMRPDKPTMSCCNKEDCYPTEAHYKDGHWVAKRREDNAWLTVPPAKIERNRDSPDGRSHLCAPKPQYSTGYQNGVICFVVGTGS